MGLAEGSACALCGGEGSLRHRAWHCPATEIARQQSLVSLGLLGFRHDPLVETLFAERGLAPDLRHLYPPALTVADVRFDLAPPFGMFTGSIFIDGSGACKDAVLRRTSCGAVQNDANGKVLGSFHAAVLLLTQTVPGVEAYALCLTLQQCMAPLTVWIECQACVDGV